MTNDNHELRAFRDDEAFPRQAAKQDSYAGLWKQIALGIIVGYTVLGLLSTLAWAIWSAFMLSQLKLVFQ